MMRRSGLRSGLRRGGAAIAVIASATLHAQGPRPSSTPATSLTIAGDIPKTVTLPFAELKTYPRTTVTLQEDGRTVAYEGVLLGEVLTRAGAPLGPELRGANVASYVLATARDGYQVVFSLAEVDPAFTGSQIILADTIDGKPLFDYQGPIRIVSPGDKRGARSIRMLERLDVVRLRK
jgi:DMSO/TMAO reductase YedYZ molybdopterin-dependent catalytic subunit